MNIPEYWQTPNNPATYVRVFRINIERPRNSEPVADFYVAEAAAVAGSNFERQAPEFSIKKTLTELLSDDEVKVQALQVLNLLNEISYILYLQMKKRLETPVPPVAEDAVPSPE